ARGRPGGDRGGGAPSGPFGAHGRASSAGARDAARGRSGDANAPATGPGGEALSGPHGGGRAGTFFAAHRSFGFGRHDGPRRGGRGPPAKHTGVRRRWRRGPDAGAKSTRIPEHEGGRGSVRNAAVASPRVTSGSSRTSSRWSRK